MPRGVIDYAALAGPAAQAMRAKAPDGPLPFDIRKVGHVVLYVTDLERAVDFYTRVLGFRVSDVLSDTMMDGGMVFMRCNADHHGVALVGAGAPRGRAPAAPHGLRGRHRRRGAEGARLAGGPWRRDPVRGQAPRRRAGRRRVPRPGRPLAGIYWGLDRVVPDGPDGAAAIRPPGEWREVFTLEDALDNAPPGQDTTLADPSLRRDAGLRRD